MDNAATLDVRLAMMLENLKKLGDGNNEEISSTEKYVQHEICALLDAEASIGENFR